MKYKKAHSLLTGGHNKHSLRIKFLTIALVFLAFLGVAFVLYSMITTVNYNRICMKGIEEAAAFEMEKTNNRFFVIFAVSSLLLLYLTFVFKNFTETHTREHAEKERIGAELSMAAEIQACMLPYVFPPFPDRAEFDIHASMLPAKEVGGDFYDFFLIDKNNLAVVIADVSGKGVPAALFMGITKTLIKSCVRSGKSPGEVFKTINNVLCENNGKGMFVTAFMGYYNIETGSFVYVNAGHTPPLLKKTGKDYESMYTKPCFILGCINNIVYEETEIFLEPGDTLYLYTDGVTEAMNTNRSFFTSQRLVEVLNNNKDSRPGELLSAVKREIDDFAGGADQADDITMLALKVDHYTQPEQSEQYDYENYLIEAAIEELPVEG